MTTIIKALFANDIARHIEEVIKVDQTDEQILRDELSEYVITDALRTHFTEVVERYWETPKKPHEGIGVWVSGFFGSGKSSFAKYLGLALENRKESYTIGKDVSVEQVTEMGALAKKHGFHLAGFRSFEKAVSQETIDRVKAARKAPTAV